MSKNQVVAEIPTTEAPEVDPAVAEAAAVAAAQAAAEKAQKAAEAKALKEAAAAEKKAQKEAAKAEKEAALAAAKAEKEAAKAAKEAAKEANKMPEQNGVRRPKPETLCGKAWAVFDQVSAKNGAPASIKESLEVARPLGYNEGNVKCEYARWRKFHSIVGRIAPPVVEVAATEGAAPAEAPAEAPAAE